MNEMLMGATASLSLVISLFFLHFWRSTHDRFFLFLSVSFVLQAADRLLQGYAWGPEELPMLYAVRIVAYTLILVAVLDKNKQHR